MFKAERKALTTSRLLERAKIHRTPKSLWKILYSAKLHPSNFRSLGVVTQSLHHYIVLTILHALISDKMIHSILDLVRRDTAVIVIRPGSGRSSWRRGRRRSRVIIAIRNILRWQSTARLPRTANKDDIAISLPREFNGWQQIMSIKLRHITTLTRRIKIRLQIIEKLFQL